MDTFPEKETKKRLKNARMSKSNDQFGFLNWTMLRRVTLTLSDSENQTGGVDGQSLDSFLEQNKGPKTFTENWVSKQSVFEKPKSFIPKKMAVVSKYAKRDPKDGVSCPNFQ